MNTYHIQWWNDQTGDRGGFTRTGYSVGEVMRRVLNEDKWLLNSEDLASITITEIKL